MTLWADFRPNTHALRSGASATRGRILDVNNQRITGMPGKTSGGGGGGTIEGGWFPYDFALCFPGKPGASLQATHVIARACTLPAGLAGSQAYIGTNPAATLTLTLKKVSGGVATTVGTIAFSIAGVPSFAFAAAIDFAAGDVLLALAPAAPDATGADIAISFARTLD